MFGVEAEKFGGAIDCGGRAFQLEIVADGSLVEIEMEAFYIRQSVSRAEFFVTEAGAEAEGAENGLEIAGRLEINF